MKITKSLSLYSPITEFRWNTSEWTDCSRSCGGGNQTRNVTCLELKIHQAEINITVITGEVDEGMCVMFEGAGTRPTNYQLCNEQSCAFWQAGQFSDVCCTLRWIPFSSDCIVFIRAAIICL